MRPRVSLKRPVLKTKATLMAVMINGTIQMEVEFRLELMEKLFLLAQKLRQKEAGKISPRYDKDGNRTSSHNTGEKLVD